MIKLKAICCLLFFSTIVKSRPQDNSNFEDADKGNDFSISSIGEFDLRHSIPGSPDIDYPIYSIAPKTSFTCDSKHEGYYADVETRCQVFRICANTDLSGNGFAFLCPNGTLFSQRLFVCDWYRNVDCSESENFYYQNEEIGQISGDKNEMMEMVKKMVEYPMRTISKALEQSSKLPISTLGNKNSTKDKSESTKTNIKNNNVEKTRFKAYDNNRAEEKFSTPQAPSKIRGNQRNSNRQLGDNKSRTEQKAKTTTGSTSFQITAGDNEAVDVRNNVPASKVYVNNLGELSTDANSSFDSRTAYIVGDSSNGQQEQSTEKPKKTLNDVLGDSEVYKSHIESERKEKLKQGLPGSEKTRVISAKATIKATSGVAVAQIPIVNKSNNKVVENISYKANSQTVQPTASKNEYAGESTKTNLNFAASLNAALIGYDLKDGDAAPEVPQFIRDYVEKKTTVRPSLRGNHIVESIEIKSRQPYGKFLNLADNVNSGLFEQNDGNKSTQTSKTEIKVPQKVLAEPKLPSPNKIDKKEPFKGYNTFIPRQNTNFEDLRQGRQFQFLGAGFTREQPTTKRPFNSKYANTEYLPPLQDSRSKSGSSRGTIRYGTTSEKSTKIQTNETLSIDIRIDDKNLNDSTKNTNKTNSIGNQIPDLLLDINDINAAKEIESTEDTQEDIHVKKRAESLLINGVQQAIYESTNTEIADNDIGSKDSQEEAIIGDKDEPFMIHVPTEDEEDENLNSLRLQEVLNKTQILDLIDSKLHETTTEKALTTSEKALTTTEKALTVTEKALIVGENSATTELDLNESRLNEILKNEDVQKLLTSNETEQYTTIKSKDLQTETENPTDPTLSDSTTEVLVLSTLDFETTDPTTDIPTEATTEKPFDIKARYANLINARRQTAKPIVYSKKPFTFRNYSKTTATTTARPRYLSSQRRRPLNRFALKELSSNSTTNNTETSTENSSEDLQAIANTHGGYRGNRIRNDSKIKSLLRQRTSNYTPIRTRSTTTKSPNNSNLNLNTNSLTSFGTNISQTNPNNELLNLQNSNYQLQSHKQSNRIISQTRFGQDISKAPSQQQFGSFNQNNFISRNQQEVDTVSKTPVQSKPASTTYTQIPGTNIRISKSKEEASFIYSNDPKLQSKQQQLSQQENQQHKNGYVPLNEYISNTLLGEIKSIGTPNQQQFHSQNVNLGTQNQQASFEKHFSQYPTTTNLPPTVPYTQPQPTFFGSQSLFGNFNQQQTTTPKSSFSQDFNQFNNIFSSAGATETSGNNYLLQSHFQPTTPRTIQFSFGQQQQPQQIQGSFLQNALKQQQQTPIFQGQSTLNTQQNEDEYFSKFIFDQLPIAQRRLDLAEDVKEEGTLYTGLSSYEVPLGSIGRLPNDMVRRRIR